MLPNTALTPSSNIDPGVSSKKQIWTYKTTPCEKPFR